jgi:probable phosphoglycerate mutase
VGEGAAPGSTGLVLVRHGETAGNRERRFQPYDTPLSDLGRLQASRVAARLAAGPPATALYASDLARARETAGIIGARLGLAPVVAPALRELDVGDLKGRPHGAAEGVHPGGYEGWIAAGGTPRLPGPAGESLDDLVARVVPWLEALLPVTARQRVIVVSHGLTLGVALAHLLGWDQREAFRTRRVRLLNTAVSDLDWVPGGPARCRFLACGAHLHPDLLGAGSGLGPA